MPGPDQTQRISILESSRFVAELTFPSAAGNVAAGVSLSSLLIGGSATLNLPIVRNTLYRLKVLGGVVLVDAGHRTVVALESGQLSVQPNQPAGGGAVGGGLAVPLRFGANTALAAFQPISTDELDLWCTDWLTQLPNLLNGALFAVGAAIVLNNSGTAATVSANAQLQVERLLFDANPLPQP